ncbi:hypothetical protein AB0K16_38130 [Nonomuraea jabiensis]|uniref:Uncharacterized protein n=1 Tax=Nonomuraea jabiensis TaxID=882448 RepID=A0A7W9LHB7_9ACTN|nr:hypothetical protein [Nonomuraea jabiensis]MBB5783790.1 hypothetical protein [Nonomuraea jabiensis]
MRGLLAAGAAVAVVLSSGVAAHAAPAAAVAAGAASGYAAAFPKFKAPKPFGTTFQSDPKHDFTKGIHSRHDGILRGRITEIRGDVAEYEPIKWKKGTETEGYFVGPPEGDVMAYASPVAKDVVYLSAFGCSKSEGAMTVNRNTGLGSKRCPRSVLMKREGKPALITVYKGKIVQVQEIWTP